MWWAPSDAAVLSDRLAAVAAILAFFLGLLCAHLAGDGLPTLSAWVLGGKPRGDCDIEDCNGMGTERVDFWMVERAVMQNTCCCSDDGTAWSIFVIVQLMLVYCQHCTVRKYGILQCTARFCVPECAMRASSTRHMH